MSTVISSEAEVVSGKDLRIARSFFTTYHLSLTASLGQGGF